MNGLKVSWKYVSFSLGRHICTFSQGYACIATLWSDVLKRYIEMEELHLYDCGYISLRLSPPPTSRPAQQSSPAIVNEIRSALEKAGSMGALGPIAIPL